MAIPPRYALSICAGVGGFDLGLRIAFPRLVTACFCEREVTAAEVLASRMEEGSLHPAPIYSDLLTFDGNPWRGVIHTVIAGLPCQPYSVAGKQLGHDDARAIWPAFIRVLGEVQPDVVYLENVPQFIRYFRPVGEALQGLGYTVEEPLFLTASEVGASHKRERFFALAHRPQRGRGVLRESSGSDGLTYRGNEKLADTSRDERDRPLGESGARRGVRETGYRMGGDTGDAFWSAITGTAAVADPRHGLFQVAGRGPQRRDGTGPAVAVLEDAGRSEFNRRPAQSTRKYRQGPSDHDSGGSGALEYSVNQRQHEGERWPVSDGSLRDATDDSQRSTAQEPGIGVGHTDHAGLEGREFSQHSADERLAGASGDPGVADAEGIGRHSGLELSECEPGQRREQSPGRDPDWSNIRTPMRCPGCGGYIVGGGCTCSPAKRRGLPVFAPGPRAVDLWQDLLVRYPELRPAISSEEIKQLVYPLVNGAAATLAGSRTDQLRACGNAVVPLQAALAIRILAKRAGLI